MSEYLTAKSYRNMKWDGDPFEKDGKMYVNVSEPCSRCGGKGRISYWGHINGGLCYDYYGSGVKRQTVRVYTEKEIAAQEAAAARKEARRIKALEETSEANKQKWMENHAFGKDGLTWCVFGDDTYAIKDWLKEQGCKFDPLLKWHCHEPLDVPAGYGIFSISFEDIFNWNMYSKEAEYKENAKEEIDRKFREAEGPSESEYVGEIGERLRNLTAVYKSVRGFSGAYGWTNIYTFECGDDVLVWFTAKELDLEKGAVVDLTATVKKHEEFRGVKTTQLSRAIIKEIK